MIRLGNDLTARMIPILRKAKNDGTLSFTTDLGNKEHSGDHYMVVTAHWIDENFDNKSCHLEMQEFNHCVYALAEEDQHMQQEWGAPSESDEEI